MRRATITPRDIERDFKLNELFFSTTDYKGIITSGNSIFVRVSGYSQTDLMGAPHNVIRHPDMPRCVFKLLWDFLQAGKPIAAYVKNMAADGLYYWVVALVTPVDGGYLSIRFKPSSPVFEVVKGLYNELLALEQSFTKADGGWRAGMDAAGARLMQVLQSKGFDNYETFMTAALRTELTSRDSAVGTQTFQPNCELGKQSESNRRLLEIFYGCSALCNDLTTLFERLDEFATLNETLHSKSAFILDLAQSMRLVSLNASVESHRLADQGSTLSVVSGAMGTSSVGITKVVSSLNQEISKLTTDLKDITFKLAAGRLQAEMITVFSLELLETESTTSNTNGMLRSLQQAFTNTFGTCFEHLSEIQDRLATLNQEIGELGKVVSTLRFIQLNGMIESARCATRTSFGSILGYVAEQIERAQSELNDLNNSICHVQGRVAEIRAIDSRMTQSVTTLSQNIEQVTH